MVSNLTLKKNKHGRQYPMKIHSADRVSTRQRADECVNGKQTVKNRDRRGEHDFWEGRKEEKQIERQPEGSGDSNSSMEN